jgi:uncharacterized protein
MNLDTEQKLESQTFKRLINHLESHTEVQNIDLMILADFCRNCLAKWYLAAAEKEGVEMDYDRAREKIYGMPYSEWKKKFQTQATPEQMAAFEARNKN